MVMLPVGAMLFLAPQLTAPVWPWMLTPLTARAVGAWLVGLGTVAALGIRENDFDRDAEETEKQTVPVLVRLFNTRLKTLRLMLRNQVTEEFRSSGFKVFGGAVAAGGVVKAFNAKGLAGATQGQIETMTEYARSFGAKGLAYIKVENGEWKSPIVKFFSDAERSALTKKLGVEEGDLILFAADQWLTACEILGKIRLYCADVLKGHGKVTVDPNRFDFLWVVDFPLLSFDKEQNRWYSSHHPFTAPVAEDIPFLTSDPKKVRGQHYDIVVNGWELGGGSIRIHQPDVQKTVFEQVLQISPEETKLRFGYLLEAFRYGAPPHGGIALGFDRLIAILCGTPSIRDVIAFPKTAKGVDLMTNSPAPVTPKQLRDLHLELKAAKRE